MATIDNTTRGMFGDLDPKRDPREQITDGQLRAALPAALGTAGEVLGVLALLPQAFAQAQRNELARLERSDREPKQSPRVEAARASIARAETLRTTSAHGEARFARFVAALDETSRVMHGFVSARDLQPLANYRVEVGVDSPNDPKAGGTLSATTAADGYFRIVLQEKGIADGTRRDRVTAALGRMVGGKVDAKNAAFKAAAAADADANSRLGRVVVRSPGGEVVYEDPVAVELDTGDVYREYIVGTTGRDTVPPPPQTVPPGTTPVPGATANPRGNVDPKTAADAKAAADANTRASTGVNTGTKRVAAQRVTPAKLAAAIPTPAAPVRSAASTRTTAVKPVASAAASPVVKPAATKAAAPKAAAKAGAKEPATAPKRGK